MDSAYFHRVIHPYTDEVVVLLFIFCSCQSHKKRREKSHTNEISWCNSESVHPVSYCLQLQEQEYQNKEQKKATCLAAGIDEEIANWNWYQHSGWQPLNDGPQMSAQRQIAVLSPAA